MIYAHFKHHNYIPKNPSVRISRKYANHSSTEKMKKIFGNIERRRANGRNLSLETLYSGQFTLITQLIKPNYLAILPHRRSTTVSLVTYSF